MHELCSLHSLNKCVSVWNFTHPLLLIWKHFTYSRAPLQQSSFFPLNHVSSLLEHCFNQQKSKTYTTFLTHFLLKEKNRHSKDLAVLTVTLIPLIRFVIIPLDLKVINAIHVVKCNGQSLVLLSLGLSATSDAANHSLLPEISYFPTWLLWRQFLGYSFSLAGSIKCKVPQGYPWNSSFLSTSLLIPLSPMGLNTIIYPLLTSGFISPVGWLPLTPLPIYALIYRLLNVYITELIFSNSTPSRVFYLSALKAQSPLPLWLPVFPHSLPVLLASLVWTHRHFLRVLASSPSTWNALSSDTLIAYSLNSFRT